MALGPRVAGASTIEVGCGCLLQNPQTRPDLFGADQLGACDITKRPMCTTGRFFNRLGYDPGVNPNPELYTPLLNSHLLENYLIKPARYQASRKH